MEYLAYLPKTLGLQLKRVRKNKGLTQKQAGSALLLEQLTVSSVENGAPGTRLETLLRVCCMNTRLDILARLFSRSAARNRYNTQYQQSAKSDRTPRRQR